MRNLIALSLVFSFGLFADDHADEPEYKPSKAEYYVSVFKKGKDMDDMMAWAEDLRTAGGGVAPAGSVKRWPIASHGTRHVAYAREPSLTHLRRLPPQLVILHFHQHR